MKVVIGLGQTGLSCIAYLVGQGQEIVAMDSASAPASYAALQAQFPKVKCCVGQLDTKLLVQAEEIIVSPGVPTALPELSQAKAKAIPIVGDIELFARVVTQPLYAVTGSNGKTTVTSLVGEMVKKAKAKILTAGNIGIPVLDLLKEKNIEGYMLELSSFQLETTSSLKTKAACVLNVTEDHLDRYEDFAAYKAAKLKIYQQCEHPIVNYDEPQVWQNLHFKVPPITFSIKTDKVDYGVLQGGGETYLTRRGERILNVAEMALQGSHHWQNALCALAFGEVMGLPLESLCDVLREFQGLAHRCQLVSVVNEVAWYDDSKGTNVGATQTAIKSLSSHLTGNLILIAGGVGKGADFTLLRDEVNHCVSHLILMGEDRDLMATALANTAEIHFAESLKMAVTRAQELAAAGDAVLLSPACASFDMFANYADRGDQFINLVKSL